MKGVVLAAGLGVRLKPFTLTRPKVMIPVGGAPLLEWTLRRLRGAGVREILIITHHMDNLIKDYFGSGSKLGLKLIFARQERVLGTADAFRVAEDFVEGEEFLGLNGDLYLSPGTIERVLEGHREGEVTMAVVPVETPSRYGIVTLEGGLVRGLVEKPEPGREPSRLANAGIYIFPHWIFEWIRRTPSSSRGEYEITESLRMMMEAGETIRAVEIAPDSWLEIGYPWKLLEANERILRTLEHRVEGDLEGGAVIISPVRIGKGTRVRSGSYIEGPVLIGEGCDIGPNCYIRPHTSIGSGVRVGNGCEVKNSIVMDGTHISHLCYVGDTVIGERCNLGAGTITANLRFDGRDVEVRVEDRVISSGRRKLGAFIGDEAQTGVNVSLMPGVKIGPRAWIAPGLTVYEDIPEGVLYSIPRGGVEPRARRHI